MQRYGITILSLSNRPEPWVQQAEQLFLGRLRGRWQTDSRILKPCRGKIDEHRCKQEECEQLQRHTPAGAYVIALEERGRHHDSVAFSSRLAGHLHDGAVTFWLGGAAGLSRDCVAAANETWSLSALTFAHNLARVVLAEQIYRAWSIDAGHPYHRD